MVNPIDVIINGKIPLKVIQSSDSENIIYCKSINEYLFNVCVFTTKEKDLILEFAEEYGQKYVNLDVQYGDKLYPGIKFKIIINEKNTPYSIFNPSFVTPVINTIKQEPAISNIQEEVIEETKQEIVQPVTEETEEEKQPYVPLKSGQYYEVAINGKVPMTMLESDQAENILFCNSFQDHLFNVGIFKTKDSELILEYSQENNKKHAYADLLFENGDYYNRVKFKVVIVDGHDMPYSTFNLKTLDQKTKTYVEFTGISEIIPEVTQIVESPVLENSTNEYMQEIADLKLEYNNAIEKAKQLEKNIQKEKLIIEEQKKIIEKKKTIIESVKKIESTVWTNILEKLHKFKSDLKITLKESSKKDLDEYIVGKLKDDIENSIKLDEKIEEIVNQHKNIVVVKEEFTKYVDRSVQKALTEAKRFAGLIAEGGGGTVAVQFANGGTIDGDLNVTGQYLSGGLNLLDIFQSGFQPHLNYNETNYLLSIVNGNTVSLSSINAEFTTNSSNLISNYNTFKSVSASYAYSSDVQSNYLKLSGGTITNNLDVINNLTVYGNLTALGDSHFVNTVFTTTSALSVINVGTGPALYVYQGPGIYDVASFYDGDGIEVLHVGNAQPGGRGHVGINESSPAAELTVNGSISSNKDITVNGGNSLLWNSNYTTVQGNSSNWNSSYNTVHGLSGDWSSVYNSWHELSSGYVTTHYLSTNNVLLSAATVTDNINVGGTGYFSHIAATSKSFYIVHPTDNTKHLQYGSLESPYHGVRLTGKSSINKECHIILPEYIKDLVKDDGVNVQLTNINHTQQLFVKKIDIDNNLVMIGRKYNLLNKNKSYEFYWSFTAIRKDIPDLKTVL